MKLRYYIYPQAYNAADRISIEGNLKELNSVIFSLSDRYDIFCYDQSLFNVTTSEGNTLADVIFGDMPDVQFSRTVLPKMLNRLTIINRSLCDKSAMDEAFKDSENALWGIIFPTNEIYTLSTAQDYLRFRHTTIFNLLNENTFRELKSLLFKNLIFSDDAIEQITHVGDKNFHQLVSRLMDLERYNAQWTIGAFSTKDINAKTSLNVSDESDSVKGNEKLSRERLFSLPNIGSKYCFLHIKTGDYRFHFYPNEENHRIYMAYIGPHLTL